LLQISIISRRRGHILNMHKSPIFISRYYKTKSKPMLGLPFSFALPDLTFNLETVSYHEWRTYSFWLGIPTHAD
ncbi:hypothetical protein LOAG_15113, partial [Loa loa]